MWAKTLSYFAVFSVATFKYMFSAAGGIAVLSFWETYFSAITGACASFLFFYFGANMVNKQMKKYRLKKEKRALEKDNYVPSKKFTYTNKLIVKVKVSKFGFWLIAGLCPLLLSVPLGTMIVAKLYGGKTRTVVFSLAALMLWGFPITIVWDTILN